MVFDAFIPGAVDQYEFGYEAGAGDLWRGVPQVPRKELSDNITLRKIDCILSQNPPRRRPWRRRGGCHQWSSLELLQASLVYSLVYTRKGESSLRPRPLFSRLRHCPHFPTPPIPPSRLKSWTTIYTHLHNLKTYSRQDQKKT